jgi:glycosyltransferase involved in cell wall biosynthesis
MTNNAPMLSVLMPVFNGERYLRESIESILNQSRRDFEFIIIDDGSTDASAEIIASYNDPRIVNETFRDNRGLIAALNRGLQIARGLYVARHDADDVALPQRLQTQVQFLDTHSDLVLIGSAYTEIDEAGQPGKRVHLPEDFLSLCWHSVFQNPFVHSTVMFRRASVLEIGSYACGPEATHVEDYELWLRLIWARNGALNIKEPLVRWRLNSQSVSRTFASQQSENFQQIVRANLRKFVPALSDDNRLGDLIWRLQVSGGFDEPLERVELALKTLEDLTTNFCSHFQLNAKDQQRVRKLAQRRAAKTLIHNAQQCAYAGRDIEADELAGLALGLDQRLAFTAGFGKLRLKSLLGQQSTQRLRAAQKRLKSAIHPS